MPSSSTHAQKHPTWCHIFTQQTLLLTLDGLKSPISKYICLTPVSRTSHGVRIALGAKIYKEEEISKIQRDDISSKQIFFRNSKRLCIDFQSSLHQNKLALSKLFFRKFLGCPPIFLNDTMPPHPSRNRYKNQTLLFSFQGRSRPAALRDPPMSVPETRERDVWTKTLPKQPVQEKRSHPLKHLWSSGCAVRRNHSISKQGPDGHAAIIHFSKTPTSSKLA